jgi:hypothetical protein
MTNKQPERSVEEIVDEFDAFLDKYTGKHEKDNWLKQSLYADTVQVRKDLIVKEFTQTLQTERQRCEEMYAEGYKQGKFDAEITAKYGDPQITPLTNDKE